MKNIFKTLIFAFCLVAIASCEDDKDPLAVANGFQLRSSETPSAIVLDPLEDANKVLTLTWDRSNNGGGNTVSTYSIEMAAAGTNFAAPVTLNNGNIVIPAFTYDVKVAELNKLANQLPTYVCGQEMAVEIRVKSILGSGYYNEFVQYSSNVITLNLKPYSQKLPTMMFASSAPQADAVANLAASAPVNKDYEGYMYLQPGMYKFYQSGGCGTFESPVVYGDNNSGSFNRLQLDGGSYQVLTAGFYYVKANLTTSEYAVRPITWNIFGTAKPLFPGANTLMTYDQTSGLWKLTATLSNGYDFQFRTNGTGNAALVLGNFDATKIGESFAGTLMSYGGGVLLVPGTKSVPRVNTTYDITLDLRSPRNYSYTIVAQTP